MPHVYRRLAETGLMARASPLLFLLETDRLQHARWNNEEERLAEGCRNTGQVVASKDCAASTNSLAPDLYNSQGRVPQTQTCPQMI